MNKRARQLRAGQTDTERKLWSHLRNRGLAGFKFKRQHPIGKYIVDFACLEMRLIVEVDGGHHSNAKDEDRTRFLELAGYRVIRFWDNQVLQETEDVLEAILASLPRPSP
jgi:adenine-specific DNA-methyltransferase